jgi:hypothetical protein
MQWKAGKIVSMDLHARSNGAIRLIPPHGQVIAGIRSTAGQLISAGKDGAISLTSGSSYSVAFR